MRVALAVEGTRGDLQPMIALARRLQSAGHEVRLCGSSDARDFVEARGVEFRPGGSDVRSFLSEASSAVAGGSLRMSMAAHRYFDVAIEAQFRLLPEATRGFDLILGAGVQLAGPSVAELHGVPYRFVTYCPAMLPSPDHAPVALPTHALPGWANRLLWWAFRSFYDLKLSRPLGRERRALGLDPVRRVFDSIVSSAPLLATDAALAPVGAACPYPLTQVGYLFHPDPEPIPPKLEAFLEDGPPPVYLGFGSMTDPNPGATTRAILEAVDRVGCRALLSRGWAGLGDVALPGNVFPLESVDHAALFPRTAAVVHHGGSGTTHTAARAGVPQLLVPHLLDQYYFAHRVRGLGLGPPALWRNRLSADALTDLLRELVENEVLSERARSFARDLASAQPGSDLVERIVTSTA